MSNPTTFFVRGVPVPQGSKRAFVVNGRPVLTEQGGDRHKTWRADLREAAQTHWTGRPSDEPIHVSLLFTFARPKSHFGSGKNKDVIKDLAPRRHTQKPDIDKLTRSVLDALTGIVWLDDQQVCSLSVDKHWATPEGSPGVLIYVSVGA